MEKIEYYLGIAESILVKSTCLRRKFGAIVVNNDEIIATGYNGAPRGCKHCKTCKREDLKVERGTRYELCRSVHAEANCIISASRKDMMYGTLYLVGKQASSNEYVQDITCCDMCKRLIINAGISKVVYKISENEYREIPVYEWIEEM